MKLIVVLFALGYLCSPLDFIPDVIPVLGWLDDLGVLAWAWSYCTEQKKIAA